MRAFITFALPTFIHYLPIIKNIKLNSMKKFVLLLIICLPIVSFGQKIQNLKTKEIVELKDKVENYCSVVMQPLKGKFGFFIGLNELGVWQFLDTNAKPIEYKTIIAVMNYMHKNGWEYTNNIGGNGGAAPQYYFRKKE